MNPLHDSLNCLLMFSRQVDCNPLLTQKNLEKIFSDGIRNLDTLLSLSNVLSRNSDFDLIDDLVKCNSTDEIIKWKNKYTSWWRVILIIMDPQYKKSLFWSWQFKFVFLSSIPDIFPEKKYEVVFRLYLEYYGYFLQEDKYSIFSEIMDQLSLNLKKSSDSWFGKFVNNEILFRDKQMCSSFGKYMVRKRVLPDDFFLKNNFPSGSERWDFFQEYYLQTIDASDHYLMSTDSEKSQEWLLREIYQDTNGQRKTLANAEFLLVYVNEHSDPEFRKILSALEKTKVKGLWLSDVGFSKARAARIALANEKIETLLNSMAFEEFFASFAFDKSRKDFWSAYLPYLSKVKVFLPPILFSRLSGKMNYNGRFARVDARYAPAVLMMQIHNIIIVEFGVSGNALYVYDESDPLFHEIVTADRMSGADAFKNTALPLLTTSTKHGRLIHTEGAWQIKMRNWLFYNAKIRI